MFALGHKRTLKRLQSMSALPSKADMVRYDCDVRFVRLGDIFLALTSIVVPLPRLSRAPAAAWRR